MRKKPIKADAWESLEFTIARAEEAMRKEGWETLPGEKMLIEKGYYSLSNAINQYHGKIRAFRILLGQSSKWTPKGLWPQQEYTIQQAQKAMQEQGWTTLPDKKDLADRGYSGLCSAISKYHGGFAAFRTLLGLKNYYGRWSNLDYAIQEAQKAMQKEGWKVLPGQGVLYDKGYSNLSYAIQKYHGGLPKFRIILGQENLLGRWKNLDYTIQQARTAMKEQGWTTLPSSDVLADKGYGGLSAAIFEHHGGFTKFRIILGQDNLLGRWKDLGYTIKQAQQAMQKEGWTGLPSQYVLDDKGYRSVAVAITRYHGGFPAFRELLAKAQGQPTHKEQLESLLCKYAGTE